MQGLKLLTAAAMAMGVMAVSAGGGTGGVGNGAMAAEHAWKAATVSVEIRYEPGKSDKCTGLPWWPGMTTIDATKLPLELRFSANWIGRFQDWMITEINGVKNQGPGKPNWLYCIDGFPVSGPPSGHRLAPGAEVIWTLEAEYPPKNCE